MFGFLKRRNKSKSLIYLKENLDNYFNILTILSSILNKSKNYGQSKVTNDLVELLKQEKFDEFIKLINSVDMWGGSGAVWEVYIGITADEREFQRAIINLIDLMEKTEILGSGIKSRRRLFKSELGL